QLQQMDLLELKGIPATFDGEEFVALLKRLHDVTDREVYAPLFDRSIESSIPDAIIVKPTHKLCIVEGNYLLLQSEPWRRCKSFLDEVWFLDVPIETILPRLRE